MILKILEVNKVAPIIDLKTFNILITHRLSDSNNGKSFVIPGFPTDCIIKEIRVRANYISGQRRTWRVFIEDQNGICPNSTNIPYRGVWDSSPIGEYAYIDNEIVYISADNDSVLTVIRGTKGTVPSYHDCDTPIIIANNGLRLVFYKDSNKKLVDSLKIMDNMMTWNGVTDIQTEYSKRLIKFKDRILNINKYDILYIVSISHERVIVEGMNNSTKTVSVSDKLSSYIGNVEIQKQIVYKDMIPYSGENNLYGILYTDEKIDDTINVDVEILIQ